MVRDISYCDNADCPFTDCWRHLSQLKGEKETVIISISNFGGVCRKYIAYLIEEHALHAEKPIPDDVNDYYLGDEV